MKRLALFSLFLTLALATVRPAAAYDGYAYPPPYPPPAEEYPLLRKLLVGGVLVGVGYALGRATAPQPQPYYAGYATPAPTTPVVCVPSQVPTTAYRASHAAPHQARRIQHAARPAVPHAPAPRHARSAADWSPPSRYPNR